MALLSKTQRNAVYNAIASSPLDISEFIFSNGENFAIVKHPESESELRIMRDKYGTWRKVGDEPTMSAALPAYTIENAVERVAKWAKDVALWLDAPDLWRISLGEGAIPGALAPDSSNTLFSPDEQASISIQLKEIREALKAICELTAEQSAEIDKKFEEAEKASQRMGRKDWGMFFGGVVLSLVLPDIITPEVMGHIFMMVEHGIGHLFGGPPVGGVLSAGSD